MTDYEQLMAALTAAHRALHNRMHAMGPYHEHAAPDDRHGG